MKTQYEAFKAKNPPGSQPAGTVSGGVPGGSGAAPPGTEENTISNEKPEVADVDYVETWKTSGTDPLPPPAWEGPGGSGSGRLPSGPGTEGEFRPEYEVWREPIITEHPVIWHGEKRKRARRGLGFGPRRG
jgi:hypothetical protein